MSFPVVTRPVKGDEILKEVALPTKPDITGAASTSATVNLLDATIPQDVENFKAFIANRIGAGTDTSLVPDSLNPRTLVKAMIDVDPDVFKAEDAARARTLSRIKDDLDAAQVAYDSIHSSSNVADAAGIYFPTFVTAMGEMSTIGNLRRAMTRAIRFMNSVEKEASDVIRDRVDTDDEGNLFLKLTKGKIPLKADDTPFDVYHKFLEKTNKRSPLKELGKKFIAEALQEKRLVDAKTLAFTQEASRLANRDVRRRTLTRMINDAKTTAMKTTLQEQLDTLESEGTGQADESSFLQRIQSTLKPMLKAKSGNVVQDALDKLDGLGITLKDSGGRNIRKDSTIENIQKAAKRALDEISDIEKSLAKGTPKVKAGEELIASSEYEMYEMEHKPKTKDANKREYKAIKEVPKKGNLGYTEYSPDNKKDLAALKRIEGTIYEYDPSTGRLRKIKKKSMIKIGKHYVVYNMRYGGSFHPRVSHHALKREAIENLYGMDMFKKFEVNPDAKIQEGVPEHVLGGSFASFFHHTLNKAKRDFESMGKKIKDDFILSAKNIKHDVNDIARAAKHPSLKNLGKIGESGLKLLGHGAKGVLSTTDNIRQTITKTPGLKQLNSLAKKIPVYGQALGLAEDGVELVRGLADSGFTKDGMKRMAHKIVPMLTNDILGVDSQAIGRMARGVIGTVTTGDVSKLKDAAVNVAKDQVSEFIPRPIVDVAAKGLEAGVKKGIQELKGGKTGKFKGILPDQVTDADIPAIQDAAETAVKEAEKLAKTFGGGQRKPNIGTLHGGSLARIDAPNPRLRGAQRMSHLKGVKMSQPDRDAIRAEHHFRARQAGIKLGGSLTNLIFSSLLTGNPLTGMAADQLSKHMTGKSIRQHIFGGSLKDQQMKEPMEEGAGLTGGSIIKDKSGEPIWLVPPHVLHPLNRHLKGVPLKQSVGNVGGGLTGGSSGFGERGSSFDHSGFSDTKGSGLRGGSLEGGRLRGGSVIPGVDTGGLSGGRLRGGVLESDQMRLHSKTVENEELRIKSIAAERKIPDFDIPNRGDVRGNIHHIVGTAIDRRFGPLDTVRL